MAISAIISAVSPIATIAVLDTDQRSRAEICWSFSKQVVHIEPFDDLASLRSDWHRADLILAHDQEDHVAEAVRWGIETRLPLPVLAYARNPKLSLVVKAMKEGACDYLSHPLNASSVSRIIAQSVHESSRISELREQKERAINTIDRLTSREREILVALSNGSTSQQIGDCLGISFRTVEIHRANLRRKLGSITTAEAIKMLVEGGIDAITTDKDHRVVRQNRFGAIGGALYQKTAKHG